MNANKAKRRWLKWCRYQQKTGSTCNHRYLAGVHRGQVAAFHDHMHAKRYYPKGLRTPHSPRWMNW